MDEIMYVVAGGPSLHNYDWRRLADKRVIAVNRAYETVPGAEAVYFSDRRFFDWHKTTLLGHAGRLITGAKMDHPAVERYTLTGHKGLDLTPGCLRSGNNSGYAAINLAVHLGAKIIILLGFDMCFDGQRTHWHSGYVVANRQKQFSKMLPFFDTLKPALDKIGVTVINACSTSQIEAFVKIPLEHAA
jgi:hypothetical protein